MYVCYKETYVKDLPLLSKSKKIIFFFFGRPLNFFYPFNHSNSWYIETILYSSLLHRLHTYHYHHGIGSLIKFKEDECFIQSMSVSMHVTSKAEVGDVDLVTVGTRNADCWVRIEGFPVSFFGSLCCASFC